MIRTLFLSLLLASPLTYAANWSCKNHDFEIYCGARGCEINQENFTPMYIQLQQAGELKVCAYSACWSGQAKILYDRQHLLASANELAMEGQKDIAANFILAINENNQTGFIQGEGVAMPVQCEPEK